MGDGPTHNWINPQNYDGLFKIVEEDVTGRNMPEAKNVEVRS
jgi:hypothetical protein